MSLKSDYTGVYPGRDPALVFRFCIKIAGVEAAQFLECSGLAMERQVKQYEEGGNNMFVHMLPGRIKWQNIVLKHGVSRSSLLWQWFLDGSYDGQVSYRQVSIELGDAEFGKVAIWNVNRAFPVKWGTGPFNTKTQEIAIETLELAHSGIAWEAQKSNEKMRS